VEYEKVEKIMEAIANTACIGSKGDGKIFVSNIEESTECVAKKKQYMLCSM